MFALPRLIRGKRENILEFLILYGLIIKIIEILQISHTFVILILLEIVGSLIVITAKNIVGAYVKKYFVK